VTHVWLVPAVIVLIAGAASRYGADSRDSCDWKSSRDRPPPPPPRRSHTPTGDLVLLTRAVVRAVRHGSVAVTRFTGGQIGLWDRYLRQQCPWEEERLHWTRDASGEWHLDGHILPPTLGRPRRRRTGGSS
jgi:hypothetical protein